MHFIEADDLFFAMMTEHGTPMFETVRETRFPQTYRALFGFCAKTNSLKTAIFDMVESDNPYALNALFRCFCDHYLKFTYIFVRFLKDKSDAVGREYYSYCGAIESRDYLKAIVAAESLVGNTVTGDFKRAIDAVYPNIERLSIKELEEASGRFKYRAILRFLSSDAAPLVSNEMPFLANIVPEFAELSSFVHGGPWAEREMMTYPNPESAGKCRSTAELTFMMAASTLMMTAMAVSREFPAHGQLAANVQALLRDFSQSIRATKPT
jgi:hypothetical protein